MVVRRDGIDSYWADASKRRFKKVDKFVDPNCTHFKLASSCDYRSLLRKYARVSSSVQNRKHPFIPRVINVLYVFLMIRSVSA